MQPPYHLIAGSHSKPLAKRKLLEGLPHPMVCLGPSHPVDCRLATEKNKPDPSCYHSKASVHPRRLDGQEHAFLRRSIHSSRKGILDLFAGLRPTVFQSDPPIAPAFSPFVANLARIVFKLRMGICPRLRNSTQPQEPDCRRARKQFEGVQQCTRQVVVEGQGWKVVQVACEVHGPNLTCQLTSALSIHETGLAGQTARVRCQNLARRIQHEAPVLVKPAAEVSN